MTDITELAQSLKAAANTTTDAIDRLKAFPGDELIDLSQNEGEQVDIDIATLNEWYELSSPANILALVEALESEKRICATWRKTAESTSEKLEKAQAAERRWHRVESRVHEQACESDVKIDELEAIRAAAEKLVRCKGLYHSEQNYRALAALFGVNIPDLPPLKHENVHYADAAEMEIAALRQRIAELESSGVAPGILRCTECSFVLTKNIISVTADTITTVESESEPCPNGCGQLQPVTWKALAIHLMFTTKQGISDLLEAKKSISELESRTVKLPDGWQFEECEIEGCENGAIFSVGTGSRNIHLCDKCAHEPQNSRLKKSPLSKRLPFKMSAGIKVEAE